MQDNPLILKLGNVVSLTRLEAEAVDRLCTDMQPVERKRDIISQGNDPTHVHLIVEGWAARYTMLPDGQRQITAFFIPGDFCDLHVTILNAMDHSIVALTDCRVAFIPPQRDRYRYHHHAIADPRLLVGNIGRRGRVANCTCAWIWSGEQRTTVSTCR